MKILDLNSGDVIKLVEDMELVYSGNLIRFQSEIYKMSLKNMHELVAELKPEKEDCKCNQT